MREGVEETPLEGGKEEKKGPHSGPYGEGERPSHPEEPRACACGSYGTLAALADRGRRDPLSPPLVKGGGKRARMKFWHV